MHGALGSRRRSIRARSPRHLGAKHLLRQQQGCVCATKTHGPGTRTCTHKDCRQGAITREFVTSGYFGGIPGDPDGGATRVVTQNNAGPTYWVGKQANGSKFEAYWDKVGAVGHYDYGSLTMARTLGSDPNQVALESFFLQ